MVSLGLGVLSAPAFFCCGLLSLALNLAGLVLAIISFRKPPGDQKPNRMLSTAALVVNTLMLLATVAGLGYLLLGRRLGIRF